MALSQFPALGSVRQLARVFVVRDEAPVMLIEVTNDGRVSRRTVVTQELLERYIEHDFPTQTMQTNKPDCETIEFFWSRRLGEYDGKLIPLNLSVDMYKRIAQFARIPAVYLRVLEYKAAMHVFAAPQVPPGSPSLSPREIRDQYMSFILQSIPGASTHVCVGASFTYHFPTKRMYIFMHGLASRNYDHFAKGIETGAANATAFLVPSLIARYNLEQRLSAINLWQDRVYWYERMLGIRFDHHDNLDPSSIDFTTLTKDLNAANTNLAYVVWSCKSTARMLDFLDKVARKYRAQAVQNGVDDDDAAETEHLLLETHAHLRSWNAGLEDRADYLSKRGQALVQTVYSGIAQRDSAISLSLASTSTSLAKTSHSVAISTSRDSAVMRVIAAITVLFLPGTFTATFFSTTFFDFDAPSNGRVYSAWLWLYFLVTTGLTAFVMAGAWILWKKKERDVEQQFSVDVPQTTPLPYLDTQLASDGRQEDAQDEDGDGNALRTAGSGGEKPAVSSRVRAYWLRRGGRAQADGAAG